ncbi:MAG: pyrroline-5-carboxylate reductase [Chloroflexi bacterium]|nr:pyrroline-5-carboxylate reductase [Chloroflexota bacterium]
MRLAFIGGGNMGEALLAAVLGKGIAAPAAIVISDVAEARRQHLLDKYAVSVTPDNRAAIQDRDIVLLAIKPQNLSAVMSELRGKLRPAQLVLSIVAGARISAIARGLDHKCIVRTMPNTPAQIGEGITVWTATSEVTAEQKGWVRAIMGATGQEIYVEDEKYLDMATAVSGSGPAYVFLFVECLVEAAVNIGLPREIAEALVLRTLSGSAHLIEKSGKTPAELRRMVTSPGGTTAEAIAHFEKGGFASLVSEAVQAAHEKAKKLGEQIT